MYNNFSLTLAEPLKTENFYKICKTSVTFNFKSVAGWI